MKLIRKAGSTSHIFQIFIQDSSSTTGAGLAGLTNASSGLTAYYHRNTDTTATAISLVTMTVGTFTSSGFKEIDATNMPGWYQFCPPDAALAAGATSVGFHLKGATNMAPLPIEIDLVAYDPQVATNLGLSAVPTANPGATNGLLIAGSNAATTFASAVFTGTVTMSDGLSMSRSTTNSSALIVTGNGTGHGAVFTSGNGASGDGVQMVAASTNGNGLKAVGTGTLNGIFCQGGDGTNGDGLHCVAGAGTSVGIRGIGGGTTGAGIYGIGTAGNAAGIQGVGEGTGDGLSVSSLGGGNPISAAAANEFADSLLARNVAGGSSAGRIVSEALYPLRNLWTVNTTSGVYTVYKVDDLTIAWTAALTTNGSAQPITGSDPST